MLCRGCAGNGVGIQVTPRTLSVIEVAMSYTWQFVDTEPRDEGGGRKPRWIIVGRARDTLVSGRQVLPLARAIARAEQLLADGFAYADDCIPLEREWLCEWCHGTGVPQLSVGTMGTVLR